MSDDKKIKRLEAEILAMKSKLAQSQMHIRVPPGTRFRAIKLKNRRVCLGKGKEWYVLFKNLEPGTRKIHTIAFGLSEEAMTALVQLAFAIEKESPNPSFE